MVTNCRKLGSEEGIDTSTEWRVEVNDGCHRKIIALVSYFSERGSDAG
jgi:hypothetical protein